MRSWWTSEMQIKNMNTPTDANRSNEHSDSSDNGENIDIKMYDKESSGNSNTTGGGETTEDITTSSKIQPGQERSLLKIISHMFRQQADMSMAHAMKLERMSIEYQQKYYTSEAVIGSIENDDNSQHSDLKYIKPCNSNFESVKERKYREDMLKLARDSLEGIKKIHQALDHLLPNITNRDEEFIYDAFGLPVSKKKRIHEDDDQIKSENIVSLSDSKRGTKRNASDQDSKSSVSKIKLRSGTVLASDSSEYSDSEESVKQKETRVTSVLPKITNFSSV
jgi:hypothetical protein